MKNIVKIRIIDNAILRAELDSLFETASKLQVAQWSLDLATHILHISMPEYLDNDIIKNGFNVNKLWQEDKARMYDVRQAGFKIHQLAKICDNELVKIALRVVGQSIATGHMKEHGMVASDYAIKYINIAFPNDTNAVTAERIWQIDSLQTHIKN
jgi:hypothetical protein